MKGGSKHLTSDYSLEIRNDSVYSYLPYFGVAYNVPYGGGKGLNLVLLYQNILQHIAKREMLKSH